MEKYNFSFDRIYNVDESGISTVQKETAKRLGPKGIKQFGVISSGERGKRITVICAMSATGYIPPLFVYPRARMTPLLEKNRPIGAAIAVLIMDGVTRKFSYNGCNIFRNTLEQQLQIQCCYF
ncbi:hypothetical protein TcasGA2_TC011494 [Tribolium castaneum]|uniref:Uncharacterized protein n=1 Tax=Tribolium castaneum TaxID=7070 RepID=D7EK76_TRICA|nr:hypothetical protein TcasGA2_TC011494 [Tribolium castaneum]